MKQKTYGLQREHRHTQTAFAILTQNFRNRSVVFGVSDISQNMSIVRTEIKLPSRNISPCVTYLNSAKFLQ